MIDILSEHVSEFSVLSKRYSSHVPQQLGMVWAKRIELMHTELMLITGLSTPELTPKLGMQSQSRHWLSICLKSTGT